MVENPIEVNEELIEEWPIKVAKFGQKLTASEIHYYIEFQEYPNTSETGFASVYNVSGWDEEEARKAFSMTNIQYSYGGSGTTRTVKNCDFFPGIKVSKEERKCLSVKMCEFASKKLEVDHTSVDFTSSLFKNLFDANEKFQERATLCIFAKAHEYKCGYVDQKGIRCNGTPTLGEFTQVIGSTSSKKKFIGCTKWQSGEKNHRYLTIPSNIDLELLEDMFNGHSYHPNGIDFEKDELDVVDECYIVRPNSTRSDECPFLHKAGNRIIKGIINKKTDSCPVKFYHIIPENLKDCPFIVTVSVGKHNHPPPPPRKTPYNVKNQLQKIIDNEHILDLTARKFLTGSMIQSYLNGRAISDLHPSLNNQSKINYYIEKTRRSQYPFGQNILGVVHEFMKHEKSNDPYIRSIRFLDSGQYIVLCATKQQLKALSELTYFEIDMAFKRIHGITNEWEVAAYLPHVQKTLTFVRIFTNVETANAYQNLFEDLFNCIERDTGETFSFYHIHGKGLGCIIADQHKGQALGLGQYLSSKYPHLAPVEHLQYIYKLCQVHYKRNIDKNRQLSREIRNAMYLIPSLNTQEEVLEVLNKIESCEEPGTAAWVNDKRTPWVLSGVSYAFTKMDSNIWHQTPNNTNVGESAHANVNHDGRNLSLLAGIARGRDFDNRQWESIDIYKKYNVPDSYRNKSELTRLIQAEQRVEKRRKGKQPLLSSNTRKKQKSNFRNKENVIEIIDSDENLRLEEQRKMKDLEQDMLIIQKQKNDELEREIILLEKRKKILGL
ncbi:hypothetical protein GLOIN_2v1763409 [Rhizophagus irregularis DAOM 181602=DAOM 197198]|uniref:Uncharacterized protein n=1 Tax=Rhizophagus irregularis (strain DAOM 181602 / DAOM 197198 / MUCL 43194) TaxID=747089 RepID=A0A2H5SA45_RHIID|nr:hypothetical protein GLOIN_2v1763409 [Rhizophagus irregularis DAOM 181602=DAOM 197198]POG81481.1 hypothetical protein GLOIN_2v1763409 [Rhizophagus irregularis DAOM 181602=DAOM 197198]GBC27218.1 hypothetical protein GLOIN_2v1763409 [Rhizophagus irregularis DAOM 181602=DAOM 197198]|eukprot:XP_025188347.1 hypothetical protein GLOIN_2v1763409 [Rhizophagus irregularis DAOM 181602=DAOM 197198]